MSVYPFPRVDSQSHLRLSDSQALVRNRHPSTISLASRFSNVTNRATALEIYDLVYGNSPQLSSVETVDRIYEINADQISAVYENPLLTASSRQIIADINAISRQVSHIDVPRPLAMFKTLFRPTAASEAKDPWFEALRVWSDIEDICESESFDGHHMCIIEHAVNVLMLPGLHSEQRGADNPSSDSLDVPSSASSMFAGQFTYGPPPQPSLALPGLKGLSLPSPLHFKLRVLTRLSFNEQGRITHHRDFWDVRDVLGLLPGAQAAQWIGTRVAARGLSLAAWFFGVGSERKSEIRPEDVERGTIISGPGSPSVSPTMDGTSGRGTINALGLELDDYQRPRRLSAGRIGAIYVNPRRSGTSSSAGQAPDVDRA
ncbi:hypothetical protein BD410DRAFT_833705 [Rickenella mellea]|uniref:Uncharacterized protein n=1 Tax=Rickenella mellea TaxID=50990 RepID=A0A4R5XF53_9AGAM|nr:hypothetical protein BD410DRAFT_833705 [Rickenella mellea]